MKKTSILFIVFLSFASIAFPQHNHIDFASLWNGNKALSFNIGTDFNLTPRSFGVQTLDIHPAAGLALSLRHEGDTPINDRFSWGYQVELSYLSQAYRYTAAAHDLSTIEHVTLSQWDLQADVRVSLAYWLNDQIELQAAAGIYSGLLYGLAGESFQTWTSTALEVPASRQPISKFSIFNFDMGLSTLVQAKYYFNKNIFVSLSLRDNIGLNFFGDAFLKNPYLAHGGQRGIIMAGIGYKLGK